MQSGESPSALRFWRRVLGSGEAARMFETEALFHVQVIWTTALLDVVDENTDPATAALITDLIYEKLAGAPTSPSATART